MVRVGKVHEKCDQHFLAAYKAKLLINYSRDLCAFMGVSSLYSNRLQL